MNVLARLRESLLFWKHNLSQGLLATLGISLGISGLVAATAVSAGARQELQQLADDLGVGLVILQSRETFDDAVTARVTNSLADDLVSASTFSTSDSPLRFGRIELPAVRHISGDENYAATIGLELVAGRDISPADTFESKRTVLLSESLGGTLTPVGNMVGQNVMVGGTWMHVAGIVADVRDGPTVYSPRTAGLPGNELAIRMTSQASLSDNLELITRSAGLRIDNPASISVLLPAEALREEQRIRSLVITAVMSLSVVVLALGGTSVMNTMLMSVINRKGEIALRRAVGASTREIMLQFILEATMICALGGGIALIAGIIVIQSIGGVLPWPVGIDMRAISSVCLAILAVSLAAGTLPAWRATRVPPAAVLA